MYLCTRILFNENMQSENRPIIEIKNVSKFFGEKTALDHINLTVNKGEFVTILGPSGCGKTTLLRLIAGFQTASEGSLCIAGKEVTQTPPHKRPVNTVFQKYALFPHLNVFDNIAFGLKLKKMPKAEMEKKVKAALKMVGMTDYEYRDVNSLSGGQQQRVAIARAIVNEPEVLLLDEPLAALDLKMRKDMQMELKEMHKTLGITFVYVTHDQEEALTMSDRVIIVKDGRIEQDDPPAAIYQYPKSQFAAGFIGENNFFDIEGDEDHVLAVRPQFIEVSKESEVLEGTPKEPFYYGSVVELLFTGTFDKVFIRLDNTNQMVTAYQYYDDKKRWKADDRVGIRWTAEAAVQVIK